MSAVLGTPHPTLSTWLCPGLALSSNPQGLRQKPGRSRGRRDTAVTVRRGAGKEPGEGESSGKAAGTRQRSVPVSRLEMPRRDERPHSGQTGRLASMPLPCSGWGPGCAQGQPLCLEESLHRSRCLSGGCTPPATVPCVLSSASGSSAHTASLYPAAPHTRLWMGLTVSVCLSPPPRSAH